MLERLETSYFEKGRFNELDQTYEEMLARNPKDARIHLAIARVHLKKGDLADAGRMLNEALELDPQSVPARLLLADLYRHRGDLTRALEELESRTAAELRRAYTAIDEVLDPRQRARFRLLEEQLERRKLELLIRARQNRRQNPGK